MLQAHTFSPQPRAQTASHQTLKCQYCQGPKQRKKIMCWIKVVSFSHKNKQLFPKAMVQQLCVPPTFTWSWSLVYAEELETFSGQIKTSPWVLRFPPRVGWCQNFLIMRKRRLSESSQQRLINHHDEQWEQVITCTGRGSCILLILTWLLRSAVFKNCDSRDWSHNTAARLYIIID